MERRKDLPSRGERLPREFMKMIEEVFIKNFSSLLSGRGKKKETFVVFGEIYPEEVLLAVSLKNPVNLRMTTAYASIDFPPPSMIPESGSANPSNTSVSELVQSAVNSCVDVIASFFQTYFDEGRPVDYDVEYRQNWVSVDLDKTTRVYLRINRDNLELEAASDDFLAQHEAMSDREEVLGSKNDDDEISILPEERQHEHSANENPDEDESDDDEIMVEVLVDDDDEDEEDPEDADIIEEDDDETSEESGESAESDESSEEKSPPRKKSRKNTVH